ncbi:VUT family protein [Bartonella sp. HY406]|uniref:VUT family protein n=1 Tax=Bartonella sp. HY406 TaxID=2979331 RepID=UPI0021CA7B6C|nr:VUT family protein [Bartonella sp. HY406]UXN03774.1 VUT family protein [Bartonella sp. HY406]
MKKTESVILAIFAMCVAVTASNILVQYPFSWFGLEHVLTYGAFIYPFAFLINDLTNRRFGPQIARYVVYAGFIAGLGVSWILATPRLAIASGSAFLFAQLLDIAVFSPLRQRTWWQAPLAAALAGSVLDTLIFFGLAFAPVFGFIDTATGLPDQSIAGTTAFWGGNIAIWLSLAIGDFWVKVAMAIFMLLPYGTFLALFSPATYNKSKVSK